VRPQVDRTIRRLLGPRDFDHEDIAQQAMIELVSTIERYRGDCSLDSWTSTITAHVVYKHIRRRKTERRIFGALDADLLAETRSSSRTGREAIVRSVMSRVRDLLDQIDESKAWTFVLHDVCGYDLREIARITGVSVAAAQTRLVRGRREVHERIASDPELANLLESMEGEL
jgi:RNA polymerase sigma-70 factor (ECF subfamily)